MKRRKWWLPVVVMLALLAWWTAVGLQKQILIDNDGNFLIADAFWEARILSRRRQHAESRVKLQARTEPQSVQLVWAARF